MQGFKFKYNGCNITPLMSVRCVAAPKINK